VRDDRLRSCTGRQGIARCGVALTTWMSEQSEQFLATDPKVVAAEVKFFGDGEQVRAYLDMTRARALLLVGAAEGTLRAGSDGGLAPASGKSCHPA
jgi:hypothetical protein